MNEENRLRKKERKRERESEREREREREKEDKRINNCYFYKNKNYSIKELKEGQFKRKENS